MIEEKKDIGTVYDSFKRYRKPVAAIMLITTSLFVAAAFSLPKSYKSRAVISIYLKYFQNPLVKDFVSETYDGGELRSQRETLIRIALDDAYIDQIGEKYGILKTPAGSIQRNGERAELVKRFEILSLNSTSYQIAFASGNPDVTYSIVKDTVEQITKTLQKERKKTLAGLRDVIGARIEAMGLKLGKDPAVAVSQASVQKEIDSLNARINVLRNQFTDSHPEIAKLKTRIAQINKKFGVSGQNTADAPKPHLGESASGVPDPLNIAASDESPEIYQDLVKKFGYLNILMDTEKDGSNYFAIIENPNYPTAAVFPKKKFFLVWGLLAGVLISFMYVLIDSHWRATTARASTGNLRTVPGGAGLSPEEKRKDSGVWN